MVLSARNQKVQQLRRLLRQVRERDSSGLIVLESPLLVREAVATGQQIVDLFVPAGVGLDPALEGVIGSISAPVHQLDPSVFDGIASTVTARSALATVRAPWLGVGDLDLRSASFVVVGAGVRDPGNAGTLVRTAAAAGADAVVFSNDSVDIGNPKAVRASAGAVFHVPVVAGAAVAELWSELRSAGLEAVGLDGAATACYYDLDLTRRVAMVVGNEAHGLSAEVDALLDERARIPMANGVESVNVVAAAAAVAFELARQRRRVAPAGK